MSTAVAIVALVAGVAIVIAGAELFAEHLEGAARGLGVSAFAISVVLAGSEPEEVATAVTGSLRHLPAVSFGDVVGANIAACLVALAAGAFVAPLPFGRSIRRYALLASVLGVAGAAAAWGGYIGRIVGALLIALYAGYVVVIWWLERRRASVEPQSPADAREDPAARHVGLELALVFAGAAVLALGSIVLVEAVGSIAETESTQTDVSLTLVGLATTLELVVLAWSTARRGATDAVVGAVVGSFAWNSTLSFGLAAIARPLRIVDAARLRGPLVIMVMALLAVIALGARRGRLSRSDGVALLIGYVAFVVYVDAR
jgi:cation:H+ antiporter